MLTTGSARVQITGPGAIVLELPLAAGGASRFEPEPGYFSLTFAEGDAQLLVQGSSFQGAVRTSDAVGLIVVTPDGRRFLSTDGECSITLNRAGVGLAEGSFTCRGLEDAADPETAVGALGSFSARS
ncbi:MAG: hypothetical protein M3245_03030 [Actinomycetota bacterium]|nr:hypothetical protein [Actinomycetota bacterium]